MKTFGIGNGTGSSLTDGFLQGLRRSASGIETSVSLSKGLTDLDHARMQMVLKHADPLYVEPIGKGVHRPYRVRLRTSEEKGIVTCSEVIFKTVNCQYETKRYCQSVDLSITGPERELLAYDMDRALGFDLVPPTVGRHVDGLGYGTVMSWVRAPLGVEWVKNGEYRYKAHPENPWLHRLAAFDFITGQIDRHAANWILDKRRRVYAIDNGYSFVKGDDRRFMKCNVGKYLVGHPVNPEISEILSKVEDSQVTKVLQNRGFKNGEVEGVMKRLQEMRRTSVWGIMGGLWAPDKK